jgi:hypothetical protein
MARVMPDVHTHTHGAPFHTGLDQYLTMGHIRVNGWQIHILMNHDHLMHRQMLRPTPGMLLTPMHTYTSHAMPSHTITTQSIHINTIK